MEVKCIEKGFDSLFFWYREYVSHGKNDRRKLDTAGL